MEPEKCRVEEKKQVSGEERGLGEGESAAAATGDSETVLPLGRVQVPLSSDDDSEGGGGREIAKRPRQRSKRSKKIGFTNVLTSEQLVSACNVEACHGRT